MKREITRSQKVKLSTFIPVLNAKGAKITLMKPIHYSLLTYMLGCNSSKRNKFHTAPKTILFSIKLDKNDVFYHI